MENEYKWLYKPTNTYYRNRKDAKIALGGINKFNSLLKKGDIIYL